jgi:hypothetical protein
MDMTARGWGGVGKKKSQKKKVVFFLHAFLWSGVRTGRLVVLVDVEGNLKVAHIECVAVVVFVGDGKVHCLHRVPANGVGLHRQYHLNRCGTVSGRTRLSCSTDKIKNLADGRTLPNVEQNHAAVVTRCREDIQLQKASVRQAKAAKGLLPKPRQG